MPPDRGRSGYEIICQCDSAIFARHMNDDAVAKKGNVDQSAFDITITEARDYAFKTIYSSEERHFGLFRFNSD